MRILFVSWVSEGGAPLSTLELAHRLAERGHDVGVMLGAGEAGAFGYKTAVKAAVKLRQASNSSWLRTLLRPLGARGAAAEVEGKVCVWRRTHAENALRHLLRDFRPEVVVANSFPREQMRWVLNDVRHDAIPLGLYMREEHSVTHLTISQLQVDFVVANSEFLATLARSAGYACSFVPSIVDLGVSLVESRRRTLVLVNPIRENRPEILRELARLRSDIPCVLQESWTLSDAWRGELQTWADNLPNLTLQRRAPRPADVYRNAKLLVAPYPSGRPRVVLEAQFNGIPVIGEDQYALREALGSGGMLVGPNATIDEWIRRIVRVWDDAQYYRELSESAFRHARRSEVDPEIIVAHFEHVVEGVAR